MEITTAAVKPVESVELDLVGPLPEDEKENKYILTIQCRFSKYIVACPIPNKRSQTVANAFVEKFILIYGVPNIILTDRGKEFTSELMTQFCKLLDITQMQSTAFHHQTLGMAENSHKNLGEYLRINANIKAGNWSDWIKYWCFGYNTSVHISTTYTPYELMFGKVCRVPTTINEETEQNSIIGPNYEEFVNELRRRLSVAWIDAGVRNEIVKQKRKERYDVYTKEREYKVGDKILVKKEIGNKLSNLFDGPYEIVGVNGGNVRILKNKRIDEVHKNRTKLYID